MTRALVVALLTIVTPSSAAQYWPFAPSPPAHTKAQRSQAEWKATLLRDAREYCRHYPHDWHCNFLPR